jgi:hypothetical protein
VLASKLGGSGYGEPSGDTLIRDRCSPDLWTTAHCPERGFLQRVHVGCGTAFDPLRGSLPQTAAGEKGNASRGFQVACQVFVSRDEPFRGQARSRDRLSPCCLNLALAWSPCVSFGWYIGGKDALNDPPRGLCTRAPTGSGQVVPCGDEIR